MVNSDGSRKTPRRNRFGRSSRRRRGRTVLSGTAAPKRREDRLAANHTISDTNPQDRIVRQEHIHTRSESHEPDPLAAIEDLPFLHAADDPPGKDSYDLAEYDRAAVVIDPDLVQLVLVRSFVIGGQEFAPSIVH